ncbi:MAG: DUF305 domain-containing protein, partial [Acidobacteriota bacterium]
MTPFTRSLMRPLRHLFQCTLLAGFTVAGVTPGIAQVPIIHPGAPGEPARELNAEEAIEIADSSYSPDDVRFMQDMIPHHYQARQMADLVAERTNRPELVEVAGRIDASQGDEIAFMQKWLSQRGESVPEPTAHEGMHTDHKMAGMATPEQMAELAAAEGTAFDRLFLELMITHHEGAVKMVEELLEQPGAAYDPVLFEFTTDVTNDQNAEIERMNALLVRLSDDPRAALAAGFDNAGQALLNLELVATLPKPAGFFDPRNPAGLPPERPKEEATGEETETEKPGDPPAEDGEEAEKDEDEEEEYKRAPLLSFDNTDMAFSGDIMVAGSYHGFNIYRLNDGGPPEL